MTGPGLNLYDKGARMRITWGATVFALAVVAAGASSYMPPVHADQGAPAATITVESFPAQMKENNLADAAKDAQIIATTFGDVEKFFASRSKADGVKWAQEGQMGATA